MSSGQCTCTSSGEMCSWLFCVLLDMGVPVLEDLSSSVCLCGPCVTELIISAYNIIWWSFTLVSGTILYLPLRAALFISQPQFFKVTLGTDHALGTIKGQCPLKVMSSDLGLRCSVFFQASLPDEGEIPLVLCLWCPNLHLDRCVGPPSLLNVTFIPDVCGTQMCPGSPLVRTFSIDIFYLSRVLPIKITLWPLYCNIAQW